jgi:hypothetical protein
MTGRMPNKWHSKIKFALNLKKITKLMSNQPEDINETEMDQSIKPHKNESLVAASVKRWALSRMFLLDQQDRAEDSTALRNEFQI